MDTPANSIFSGPLTFNATSFHRKSFHIVVWKKEKNASFKFRNIIGRFHVTSWQWRVKEQVHSCQTPGPTKGTESSFIYYILFVPQIHLDDVLWQDMSVYLVLRSTQILECWGPLCQVPWGMGAKCAATCRPTVWQASRDKSLSCHFHSSKLLKSATTHSANLNISNDRM